MFVSIWIAVLCCLLCSEIQGAFPEVPPNWKLELVAQAPEVKHPSVVCTAPDGRVFVAEDPMDISSSRADAKEGRIICLHPDGKRTVFAEKLHAVFGMQYLQGKLYVLHNPFFSVFVDRNGIGVDRQELIESMNPNPWALDWNDHVPANFRLAMDGYFYVAVGDKGVYGAVGKDGKRVDLHGGGILRLKPDGTSLEVYSTGIRNVLDVALTSEDEIFTYDNTDEHNWMGRLTHMVDGGFYGYPHHFVPRRPYTLWMMHDFGGGAACGTLAYTDDALPAEYRDNLYLADFGKRQVLQVRIKREGATFAVAEHSEFFRNAPEDFRPVGIGWAHDGKGFYVCDWQHLDVKANVIVGRLWKATYTGTTMETPKPPWFLPLAMGKQITVSVQDLITALEHPSKSVRMTAQRELTKRKDTEAVQALRGYINRKDAKEPALWHTIWALHQIDDGIAARKQIISLVQNGELSVRRQAIRQLGESRANEAVEVLSTLTSDSEDSVRFSVATALGKIGNPSAIPALIQSLSRTNLFPRYAAFTALNRIGRAHPESWTDIVAGLNHPDAIVREGVRYAMRETFDFELIRELRRFAIDGGHSLEGRKFAVALLADAIYAPPVWKGEWWAYHPALSPAPQRKDIWAGTEEVHQLLTLLISDPDSSMRLLAVEGLGKSLDRKRSGKRLLPLVRKEQSTDVKAAMIRILGKTKTAEFSPELADILGNPSTPDLIFSEAVKAAGEMGGPELKQTFVNLLSAKEVDSRRKTNLIAEADARSLMAVAPALKNLVEDPDQTLRQQAQRTYARLGGSAAIQYFNEALNKGNVESQNEAITALRASGRKEAVPGLMLATRNPALREKAEEALLELKDIRALDIYLQVLQSRDSAVKRKAREAMLAVAEAAKPLLELKSETLSPEITAELRTAWASKPELLKSAIFSNSAPALSLTDYINFAASNQGDPVAGQRIFLDESAASCIRCHVVAGHGTSVGPDLTLIGLQFPRKDLIEHVLEPSKIVREGYAQWNIELQNDDTVGGIIRSENDQELVITGNDGKTRSIPKRDIISRKASNLSLMPEGLQAGMTLQDFSDLIAYLESRKSDPRQNVNANTPSGFTSLLNGNELSEWMELPAGTKRVDETSMPNAKRPIHWKLMNGVLEHDGKDGDLWTRKNFTNFIIQLEWRWPDMPKWEEFPLISTNSYEIKDANGKSMTKRVLDAGDSGVLLRGLYKAQANLFCYPVGSGESWEYRTDMSLPENVRQGVTPKRAADLPIGDWNQMSITVKGNRATIVLNGVEVITEAELPELPSNGPIGLQHEHGRIQFRNLFVKELE